MTTEVETEDERAYREWLAENFSADDLAETDATSRAEQAMAAVYGLRSGVRALGAQEKVERKPIEEWLRLHPEERLIGGEKYPYQAWLQDTHTTVYEAPSAIRERNEQFYHRLEELALFSLDNKKVQAAIDAGHLSVKDLESYTTKPVKSQALRVEKR